MRTGYLFHNSMFNRLMTVAWNQPWWECLHREIGKCYKSDFFFSREPIVKHLPAHCYIETPIMETYFMWVWEQGSQRLSEMRQDLPVWEMGACQILTTFPEPDPLALSKVWAKESQVQKKVLCCEVTSTAAHWEPWSWLWSYSIKSPTFRESHIFMKILSKPYGMATYWCYSYRGFINQRYGCFLTELNSVRAGRTV